MTTPFAGSLVWIAGLKGPQAQKLPSYVPPNFRTKHRILSEHKLSPDEYELSVLILEQRYPPPADTASREIGT